MLIFENIFKEEFDWLFLLLEQNNLCLYNFLVICRENSSHLKLTVHPTYSFQKLLQFVHFTTRTTSCRISCFSGVNKYSSCIPREERVYLNIQISALLHIGFLCLLCPQSTFFQIYLHLRVLQYTFHRLSNINEEKLVK